MSTDTLTSTQWIGACEAAAIMGIPRLAVDELRKRKLLTCRTIPGTRPRYLRAEVERMAEEHTTPAEAV